MAVYSSEYEIDNVNYIHEGLVANPYAQWEIAHKRDLGFEMGIFKNLFTISVDFFDEYRDQMLVAPRSVTDAYRKQIQRAESRKSMKKHGIEIEAEFRKHVEPNLEYFMSRGIFGFQRKPGYL